MQFDTDKTPDRTEGDVNLSPRRETWLRGRSPETQAWLQADADYFMHQSLSTPCLDVLQRACGSGFADLDGKLFLDFHGNSVHQVGYAHPRVIEAVKQQLDSLPFCPRRYTNKTAVALATRLSELAGGGLGMPGKVLLAPGGTTAVGMALKLARLATGRFKTISMWDSFHGASLDAVSVGGEALFRSGMGPLLPGTEHVPPAEPYRCLWNPDGNCAGCDLRCAKYVSYVLEREQDVAAVIAEPLRCTTVNPPPPGYWRHIREACDRHGALLIFDETALCLGRTGRMFAFEHFDVRPDIVTLGKGLGGGVFPLAAIIARSDLDIGGHIALGHYTHEKNPVACAAALATLDVIKEEGLLERSAALGSATLAALDGFSTTYAVAGQARGLGLAMGLEIVDGPEGRASPDKAEAVLYACLERGLSFKISGGSFLTLTPPLNISDTDMDQALCILREALHSAGATAKSRVEFDRTAEETTHE